MRGVPIRGSVGPLLWKVLTRPVWARSGPSWAAALRRAAARRSVDPRQASRELLFSRASLGRDAPFGGRHGASAARPGGQPVDGGYAGLLQGRSRRQTAQERSGGRCCRARRRHGVAFRGAAPVEGRVAGRGTLGERLDSPEVLGHPDGRVAERTDRRIADVGRVPIVERSCGTRVACSPVATSFGCGPMRVNSSATVRSG